MSWKLILFGLTLVGFGGLVLRRLVCNLRTRRRSQTWPRAAGTIVHSELVREVIDDAIHYEPVVKYTYEVGGVGYTNDRISLFRWSTFLAGRERRKVEEYPVGKAVDVYYDPGEPSESILEIEATGLDHILWGGFALLGAGAIPGGIMLILHELAK